VGSGAKTMNQEAILVLAMAAIAYAMLARRLSTTPLTAPIVFLGIGWLLSSIESGESGSESVEHALHSVAEVALILLLFLDAAQTDVKALLSRHAWPFRALLFGVPLSVAIGAVAAWLWLPDWSLVGVVLLAAVLAPTDAALGQAVVTHPGVPERVRRALTVESGLNDGLALPLILLLASLTTLESSTSGWGWALFAFLQLSLGPLVGLVFGVIGGWMFLRAHDQGLTATAFEGVAAVALAGATYLAAESVGGNGFIAAFVAGLGFASRVQGRCRFVYEFVESDGQLLTWVAFFLIGFGLLPKAIDGLTLPILGVVLTSLLVVRPLAIWLSLLRNDASPGTRLLLPDYIGLGKSVSRGFGVIRRVG